MRDYLIYILLCTIAASSISCRKDFEYSPSNGNLQFSKDTVYLDTIFSNIGSSTYTLKVYNRSKEDVSIPTIDLGEGENSGYRLNVDGRSGKSFTDIALSAKDSLFIFIETTFDVSDTDAHEFLYTDVLQFDRGGQLQEVPLVTLVKDAIFLFPSNSFIGNKETIPIGSDINGQEIQVEGFELNPEQLNFTSAKPYVIYGYAAVPPDETLTIEAGTRVHFHKNSGIFVKANAQLRIKGEISKDSVALEGAIIFEGDRLEPEYANLPGLWGGVIIASGSKGNTIDHLILKNATNGLRVNGDGILEVTTLSIKNTQIYNSSQNNLWAKNAAIKGENVVLGSAGNNSMLCDFGGDYTFHHTTIANYWTNSFRTGSALSIKNYNLDATGSEIGQDLIRADFFNCIIDGNSAAELFLKSTDSATFSYFFGNCLLKYELEDGGAVNANSLYNFEDTTKYKNVLLSKEIGFVDVIQNDFRLVYSSQAIDNADPQEALTIPFDIIGNDRTNFPDIGAYEFINDNQSSR